MKVKFTQIPQAEKERFPLYSKVRLKEPSPIFGNGLVKSYVPGCPDDPEGAYISVDFECFEGYHIENLWVRPDEIIPIPSSVKLWEFS